MTGHTARRFRHTAAAVLAAASLVALAGCGGSGDDKAAGKRDKGARTAPEATATATAGGSPLSGAAHAAPALDLVEQATDNAHSARVSSESWAGSLRVTAAKGVMDWSHGLTGDLTVEFTAGDMAQEAADDGMPASMRILYLPDHFYMNLANGAAAKELDGKHWVGFDLKEAAKYGGGSAASVIQQMEGTSPTKMVATLLTLPAMKNLGPAVVDGTPTTHYQDVLSGAQTGRAESGVTGETFDLYLGKGNLPIRVSVLRTTADGDVKSVTTYSDYGIAVHPQAPPAFDVASLDDAMASED